MFYASDLRAAINEEIEALKNSLANGAASSYDDYQYAVGRIAGMSAALDIAVDVLKRKIDIEDD